MDKQTNRRLTYLLILLIGLCIGFVWDSYLDRESKTMFTEVEYTSISKSDSVFIDDEFLENMSERFLFKKVANSVTSSVVYIETVIPVICLKMKTTIFQKNFGIVLYPEVLVQWVLVLSLAKMALSLPIIMLLRGRAIRV